MKVSLFIFILSSGMFLVTHHELKAQKNSEAVGLEIETDPLAYFLSGYSFHLAYTFKHIRASMGVFGIEQPGFFLGNEKLAVFSSGYDLKADYLFGNLRGLFLGVQMTYGKETIELKNGQAREENNGFTYGIRSGYRIMLGKKDKQFKGLYVIPWIALMHAPGAKPVQVGPEEYRPAAWIPFPTVHIGYRF
ncbi:hypothetical protein [Negadavirga shengliensis]|uniref:DUF3575 domain-containing protein n=1 Tax=Negadavirga shengliensis TaxID=1389218 RepID=A0ABV9T5Z6_9BACT